mmetsp:Transcript_68430/g.198429  ORF Transcript_68430/g.198429 Transcript_68430/m.198429 type:complete len:226 (+) Transcript_68430:183-860(+)
MAHCAQKFETTTNYNLAQPEVWASSRAALALHWAGVQVRKCGSAWISPDVISGPRASCTSCCRASGLIPSNVELTTVTRSSRPFGSKDLREPSKKPWMAWPSVRSAISKCSTFPMAARRRSSKPLKRRFDSLLCHCSGVNVFSWGKASIAPDASSSCRAVCTNLCWSKSRNPSKAQLTTSTFKRTPAGDCRNQSSTSALLSMSISSISTHSVRGMAARSCCLSCS